MKHASVDVADMRRLAKDLGTFAARSLPYAARNATNALAFEGRKLWRANIEQAFTIRNRFTVGSLRVEKATAAASLDRIEATLGSLAPYMGAQEFGSSKQVGGKTAIPTSAAAGQPGARPRTKVVRAQNRMSALQLASQRVRSSNRKQRNAIAIRLARKAGTKVALLETPKGKGLFRLMGGERRPSVRMLWRVGGPSPSIPRTPTLERTVVQVQGKAVGIYHEHLLKELRRSKVLGYR